jgi:hypothetical protein
MVLALIYSVYVFRGRGPTTQQVQAQLGAQTADTRSDSGAEWLGSVWSALTNEVRAESAYKRGARKYEVRLRIDDGSHTRRVREIESQGWRRVHEVRHRKQNTTDVTANADGTHTVIRRSTQHATYYFVRDDA